MALAKSTATALVQKFSWMPFFPRDNADGVSALVEALMDSARDEAHARRIVEQIQQCDDRSPLPARITSAAIENLPAAHAASCTACGGTGFVYRTQAIPTAVGTVSRCNCMKGQK